MTLTAPTGLSTSQKDRLQRFDPTMDATNAIPATIASKTDVSTVISDLASTSAGKGASCIGIEDSGGLITATTVEGALAELAAGGGAPAAHAASHTDGTDDIQSATNAQKGLATAAQITALEANTTKTAMLTRETAGAGGKIELLEATANGVHKVVLQAPAAVTADRTITVPDADVVLANIATNTAAIAAATTDTGGGAGNVGKLVELDGDGKLDGRDIGADGTKLDGIEELADVTDLTNVTTALGVTATAAVVTSTGGADDGKLAKLDPTGRWDISLMPEAVIKEATVALSTANILALHTTPIELVPAPAAGLYNEFLGSTVRASFGTTALSDAAAQGNLRIKTGTSTQSLAVTEADGVVDVAVGTEVRHVRPAAPGATQDFEAQQENIVIDNDGGAFTDPGGADTTMSITTRYRILSLV